MKRISLIVFIILLVGCSQETIQEPLQQIATSTEEQLENEYKNAYSLTKVKTMLQRNPEGKTIEQLLEDELYVKKVYGEIYEISNEQQFEEFIEQRMIEKDSIVGAIYLGKEMPEKLAKLIEEKYERIIYENDLILSTLEDYKYGIEQITTGYFIDFRNQFLISNPSEAMANKKIDEMYASLAPQLEGLSDYEKIKEIYKFVMNHMRYSVDSLYTDHTVVGFVNGKGVCQAYAVGLYIFLEKAGIEARYVPGPLNADYINEYTHHAWNMVKLEGQWYHLDATWDDGQVEEDWRYFLVSDTRMEVSRSWNKEYYEKAKGKYTAY